MKKYNPEEVELTQELEIKKTEKKKSYKKLFISLGSVILVAGAATTLVVGIKAAKNEI